MRGSLSGGGITVLVMDRVGVRRMANLLNGSTLLGRALARWRGVPLTPGPDGLELAVGYPRRFPAPRASAVTVGDVVLLRLSADEVARRAALLRHEARHSTQWARWLGVLGFPAAYGVASLVSWLRVRDFATANPFEVAAGLADGGYAGGGGGGGGGGSH